MDPSMSVDHDTSSARDSVAIHHFLCAYVGWRSDFKRNEAGVLACPKCGLDLRARGFDWEQLAS